MNEPPERVEIARLLLALFRGREDYVAVSSEVGAAFSPRKLDRPMQPEWLAKRHLGGEKSLGFYLMTPESKVWCSCVDFDNKPSAPDPAWKEKAETLHLWLIKAGLCPVTEISQSGEAAHVWLFFEEPTDAWVVRAWWVLACEKVGVPVKEIYPRQDVLGGKGLGNLVRYPLWNHSRFVDPEEEWAILTPGKALADVKRTSGPELQSLAFGLGQILDPPDRSSVPLGTTADNELPPCTLPPRVQQRLAREGSLLARRWNGDMTGLRDASRSSLAQSIATELVRMFIPTDEIAAALRVWCVDNEYEKGERSDWIQRTVSKAYEYVFSRLEEKSASTTVMRDACHAYIDTLEKGEQLYYPSGVATLDASIDGVALGEMAVLAARPGHGKSAYCLSWLDHSSLAGTRCLLISEEMSAVELGKRALCSISSVSGEHWTRDYAPMLRRDVNAHYQGRAPIYVVENCTTIDRVEDVVSQFAGIHGVRLVAVDYLQLLSGRGPKKYDQVSDVSRRLKQLARRHSVALLALCQLNREVDKRAEHEPQLSDLRDAGALEQDADLVIFLQWPKMYDPNVEKSEYRIYVKKRRNGPIRQAKVAITFNPDKQTFGAAPDVTLRPHRTPWDDEERA